ncbi:GNAT family N-acetyltransferase [Polynucleobacter paneuropaeus]|nr:GNAT family N-acetyltransferase [Polynucleobacter paneuropaeus]
MEIRYATIDDSEDLFLWRSDPLSRAMSIHMGLISLEEHKIWFYSSIVNSSKKMYIGIVDDLKIGVSIFDYKNGTAKVSININPAARNKGLGYCLLSNSILEYKKINNCRLRAVIKKENIKSIKLFKKCGFNFLNSNDFFNFYQKD